MFIDIDILRAFIERSGVVAEGLSTTTPLYVSPTSRMSGTDCDCDLSIFIFSLIVSLVNPAVNHKTRLFDRRYYNIKFFCVIPRRLGFFIHIIQFDNFRFTIIVIIFYIVFLQGVMNGSLKITDRYNSILNIY
jgi:hypothetical protein